MTWEAEFCKDCGHLKSLHVYANPMAVIRGVARPIPSCLGHNHLDEKCDCRVQFERPPSKLLEACPFCKGEAIYDETAENHMCKSCFAVGPVQANATQEQSREAWNRRAK